MLCRQEGASTDLCIIKTCALVTLVRFDKEKKKSGFQGFLLM